MNFTRALILGHTHTSEIKGFCLMKLISEMFSKICHILLGLKKKTKYIYVHTHYGGFSYSKNAADNLNHFAKPFLKSVITFRVSDDKLK